MVLLGCCPPGRPWGPLGLAAKVAQARFTMPTNSLRSYAGSAAASSHQATGPNSLRSCGPRPWRRTCRHGPACGRKFLGLAPGLVLAPARCVWSLRGRPSGRPLRFVVAALVAHCGPLGLGARRPLARSAVVRSGGPVARPCSAAPRRPFALAPGGSSSPACALLWYRWAGPGLVGLPCGAGGCLLAACCSLVASCPLLRLCAPAPRSPLRRLRRRSCPGRELIRDGVDAVSLASGVGGDRDRYGGYCSCGG